MPKVRLPVERKASVSTMGLHAELIGFRRAIDGVDEALAGLVASRVCLSHQAQELKVRAGLPVIDPQRELEIQYRYDKRWLGASSIARAILNLCREP